MHKKEETTSDTNINTSNIIPDIFSNWFELEDVEIQDNRYVFEKNIKEEFVS